ncbi:MAG: hypothetical protein KF799_08430 [Bdellovibrionales bacterium]|nr:hypothetical protein [Bdellovibrionales bacterium]
MRVLCLVAVLLATPRLWAQHQMANWLHISSTYSEFNYKEPNVMSEKGRLAGVRGELGLSFGQSLALSVGGEYQDGNLNYDGSTFDGDPVKQVTKDYVRDLRLMAHVIYAPLVLSAGVAERYWYNDLVVSYRRRTQYNYNPVQISYFMDNVYLTVEHDVWLKGTNKSHMSDVTSTARDVEFTLGKGSGFGVEIGYMIPSPTIYTRLFLRYHKWSVKQSDTQSDGIHTLVEPDNNTTLLQAGIGLGF